MKILKTLFSFLKNALERNAHFDDSYANYPSIQIMIVVIY